MESLRTAKNQIGEVHFVYLSGNTLNSGKGIHWILNLFIKNWNIGHSRSFIDISLQWMFQQQWLCL